MILQDFFAWRKRPPGNEVQVFGLFDQIKTSEDAIMGRKG
jgi:hypothetical protein